MHSVLEAKGICGPSRSSDDLMWSMYGTSLKQAIYDSRRNKSLREVTKEKLKRLDSVLEIIEKDPLTWEIHISDGKSPKKSDIYFKFSELCIDYIKKYNDGGINVDNHGMESLKIYHNSIKNSRRVIYRLLNNEPLFLIPEEVKIFKILAEKLSTPPREFSI